MTQTSSLSKYAVPAIITIITGGIASVAGWYFLHINTVLENNTDALGKVQKIIEHQNDLLELTNVNANNIIKITELKNKIDDLSTANVSNYSSIRRDLDVVLNMLSDAENQITRALSETLVFSVVENNMDNDPTPKIWVNTEIPPYATFFKGAKIGKELKVSLVSNPKNAHYVKLGGFVFQDKPLNGQQKIPDGSMNKAARDLIGFKDNLGWEQIYIEVFLNNADRHPLKSLSRYREAD